MRVGIPVPSSMITVPMEYLHEGTPFVAIRQYGHGQTQVVTGVTSMDGHAVSDHYGLRTGNPYFSENPEKNYINVYFDGVVYAKHPCEKSEDGMDINSSLAERDDWRIYVRQEFYARYQEDLNWKPVSPEEREREARKAHLMMEMDRLKKEIEEL